MLKKITESKSEEDLVVAYSILKPWAYLNGILGSQNWREKFPFRLTYHETK